MDIVRCVNGHFFDQDTYSVCPHCGEEKDKSTKASPNVKVKGNNPKFSLSKLFGGKKEDVETQAMFVPSKADGQVVANNTVSSDFVQTNGDNSNSKFVDEHTYNFWDSNTFSQSIDSEEKLDESLGSISKNMSDDSNDENESEKCTSDESNVQVATENAPDKTQKLKSDEVDIKNETPKVSSLQDQLQQATGNEGKTFGYFSINKPTDSKSSSDVDNQVATPSIPVGEPVVGWLVCVKGPAFGQSFNIYCGRNSIGRSATNRIVIPGDNHISREKHAHILYEPKKREFWIQPGESNSLAYINGDVVMTPSKLDYYSEIDVGESKLLLIPLCSETFSWEDFEE